MISGQTPSGDARYADRQRNAAAAADRDTSMYGNVLWYTARMPTGTKVIIWTATVHAARQQGDLSQQPLGARLAARWGSQLAVVGFTALGGQSSMAGRPGKPLPEAPPGSLEAQAVGDGAEWAVLNTSALRATGRVPSRLLGRVTVADWSAYFDDVVVIRAEVAPAFDAW